ncbi:MAG: hypothetical protein K2H31_09310, partial [Lachnospiraceae bacterium]|nr:hypothetical protein [Lachnospiraceae bacterium]
MKKKVVKSLQCIALSSFLLLQTVACGKQDMDSTQNEEQEETQDMAAVGNYEFIPVSSDLKAVDYDAKVLANRN